MFEWFPADEEAEEMVAAWDGDEPDDSGLLRVIEVELPVSIN